MSVVLITVAATGIGNLTARALAADGHTVYATVRDINGRNQEPVNELRTLVLETGVDLHVIELDVTSQDSADAAVATVLGEEGELDVVMNSSTLTGSARRTRWSTRSR